MKIDMKEHSRKHTFLFSLFVQALETENMTLLKTDPEGKIDLNLLIGDQEIDLERLAEIAQKDSSLRVEYATREQFRELFGDKLQEATNLMRDFTQEVEGFFREKFGLLIRE